MIAPEAQVRFGFRPLPSMDTDDLLRAFRELADVEPTEFTETFRGPPLPACAGADAQTRWLAARDCAAALGLASGAAVDFWTEAALFSQAGYTAFVYGPGDIAQAHSADEWVALEQLQHYCAAITRIIEQGQA
jgi:acetylornithine deacetylase